MTKVLEQGSQLTPTTRGPIEYTMRGTGPVVLGIHGTPGGYEQALFYFRDVFESNQLSLLAVSRPGYGRTPLEVRETPEEQADAFIALMDHLQIAKASIMVYSGGGPIALQLALRHPDRITSMVLNSAVTKRYAYKATNSISDKILRSTFGMWLFNVLAKYSTESLTSMMLDELSTFSATEKKKLASQYVLDPRKAQFIRQVACSSAPWNLRKIGLENDEMQMSQLAEIPLEEITVPTLIVHGACDGDVKVDHAREAAKRIPDAQLLISEGGSHLLELASDFDELVRKRLDFILNISAKNS